MHLGNGVYSFPEVAQLTGLETPRIREWFKRPSKRAQGRTMFSGDYPAVRGKHALSFLDMVDVFVAGKLSERGVPVQTLRRVYVHLQEMFTTKHAFARQELLTDGRKVFVSSVDEEGREHLIDILDRQHVFVDIIKPFLESLDYKDKVAARWRIAQGVVIDPAVSFGKPVVERACVATHVLQRAYKANGNDETRVAAWFDVTPDDVLAAVAFERELAA